MLSNAIYNAGLIPLNVLVTKTESTDFGLVKHDFKFQRIMHAWVRPAPFDRLFEAVTDFNSWAITKSLATFA